MITDLIYKEEVYNIIGVCMEVHRELGKRFSEIVYKDAIEYECKQKQYFYSREEEFLVHYKDIVLPHKYFADFVVFGKIILEVKPCSSRNCHKKSRRSFWTVRRAWRFR